MSPVKGPLASLNNSADKPRNYNNNYYLNASNQKHMRLIDDSTSSCVAGTSTYLVNDGSLVNL